MEPGLASPDDTSDPNAAIQAATQSSWSTIQIAVPIVSAVAALLLAGLGFYCWRRRSRTNSQRSVGLKHRWKQQGPRRFFGLAPAIPCVSAQRAGTKWEIDGSDAEYGRLKGPEDALDATLYASSHTLHPTSHSSTPSTASSFLPIISVHPSPNPLLRPPSVLSSFLAKFGGPSSPPGGTLTKSNYKRGVAKAPEYRRVNVVPESQSREGFEIEDEGEETVPEGPVFLGRRLFSGGRGRSGLGGGGKSVAAASLPNVGDTRLSTANTANAGGRFEVGESLRMQPAYATAEGRYDSEELLRPPKSDFTVTTSLLVTPVEGAFSLLQGDDQSIAPSFASVRADSEVLPPQSK
ncbi:hypothetical protein EIP91_004225 [Steccherinum ochraceum]|uniref:Uncharacterized protein n=1 Tax=Steccherinum ochraceum TaxID=92696 RepID=A0A4R0RBR3_9APHY|nr:hypothetical protein EIP91_004225 [Steccherinum ochraceum]